MIEARHVSVAYNGGPPALQDVNLVVSKGEFVFLVGRSATGKSTFLRLVNREILPTSGEIWVGSRNLVGLEPRKVPFLRREIGVVFQDLHLLPDRTVHENVAFALQAIGTSRMKAIKQVAQSLERVGLVQKARAYPGDLSGGEKQRLALARAIANNPMILLADEPTNNLDPESSEDIARLLQQINVSGTTVIVATHDPKMVSEVGARVVFIENGKVLRDVPCASYEEAAGYAAEAASHEGNGASANGHGVRSGYRFAGEVFGGIRAAAADDDSPRP